MLFILNGTVKKLLNLRMERSQSTFLLGVGEVYALISTRGDNVEFWIKDINTMDNPIKARKGESSVTLVLTDSVLAETEEGTNVNHYMKVEMRNVKSNNKGVIDKHLPAISWNVLVMIKSVWFIAIRSAVNWQEKWYLSSNFFQ